MQETTDIAVIIPAYDPEPALVPLVTELAEYGFRVIVVDDGSKACCQAVFDDVRTYADVVKHDRNLGKGEALKTGFRYLESNAEGIRGFVTADADGQHSIHDIIRVSQEIRHPENIVLGTRNLGKSAPLRSRIGNSMSRYSFAIVTGTYLEDNQTGLRGFPIEMCSWLKGVGGAYYEYEMNVLVQAVRKGYRFIRVDIEAIYQDGNATSHFKPVLDTLRIHFSLIRNGLISTLFYILEAAAILIAWHFHLGDGYACAFAAAVCLLHILVLGKGNGSWAAAILLKLMKYICVYLVFLIFRKLAWSYVWAILLNIIIVSGVTYLGAIAGRKRTGEKE